MRKLKLLFAACALLGASAVNAQSWTEGVTVSDGDYYIYNIASKLFLNRGSSYTTHATVDGAGSIITLTDTGNGYHVHFAGTAEGAGMSTSGAWIDAPTTREDYSTWEFVPATYEGYTNVYKLKAKANDLFLYWAGGNGQYGNEALTGTENNTNDYWILIPKDVRESTEGASESNPMDVTYLVKNPDMEGDNNAHDKGTANWSDGFVKQWNGSSMVANFLEQWVSSANNLSNYDVNQTLTLPAGKYRLAMKAAAVKQDSEAVPEGVVIYAGEETTAVSGLDTYSVNFTASGDPVKVGLKVQSCNVNWVRFDEVRLYYMGVDLTLLKEAYDKAVTAANAFDLSQKMANADKEALTNAKNNYTSGVSETESALKEATEALNTAVNNATASVTAYASLKAAIDRVDEVVKTTNVYDKAYFDATKESYENGNFSTQEAADLGGGDRYKSLVTAVLCGNWYIGEKRATEPNSGFYQNTWSTEGDTDDSKMTTPFFEYWVGDGDALGATTLSTTIEGLDANATYNISMLVRVRQQNNNEKAEDDITLTLNNGEAISLVNGTKIKDVFFFQTVQATAVADADGKIALAINVKEGNHISWLAFKNLTYSNDISGIAADYEALQGQAETLLNNNTVVTGSEKTALETAKGASPSSLAEYTSAISNLQSAIDAFKAAIPNYEAFEAEKAIAQELGVSDIPSPTTGAEAAAAVNDLKVAEYVSVTTNYPNSVELGDWTATGGTTSNKGQHWDGTGESTYLEQNGTNWSANSWDISFDQDVMLPAGTYIFKVAGRTANNDNVSMTLTVKKGDSVLGTVNDFPKGDTGKGIDTAGKTNFGEGTFANSNNGRGWQWRYVKFELSELTTVNIAVTAKATAKKCWVGFCNPTVQAANSDAADLAQAIENLNTAKKAATLTKNTANIGSKPFQINESDNESLWSAYESAKNNVDNYELSSSSSINEITSLVDALTTATQNYKNAELNAPADGQLFNIVLANGKWASNGVDFENEAMTYLANDRADHGKYNIQYKAVANTNLAQAFTFTKVEGNNYKLSQIDADGEVRYMCTGVPYGGNTAQIRTTINADDAMQVTVIPTATEGVYNLRNVAANQYIGGQDAGVYTVNSHINFKIVETTKPSIEVNTTEAGWGTIIVPFDVTDIPEGVTVYSCTGVDGNSLTLDEADAIEANKPYIIEGTWSDTLTGDAQGTALTYTDGALTGVYAEQDAIAGTYVMQNSSNVVGFYKVASGSKPTLSANHAYLTVSSSAREAYLLGEATAIKAIEALTSGKAEIYNAAGARQQRLQKGVNIIKSGDKTVKVMVK
ncbi:MAG: hypothetical protein K6A32_02060 [Bacteroidales bacterium]|nr:hypothetical protein [Bacteroidales bacterium]